MDHRTYLIPALIAGGLLLGACQLQVAPAKSAGADTSAVQTTPSTQPGTPAGTTSAEPSSDAFLEEDARSILQKSAQAMLALESYDYTAESTENFGGKAVATLTTATIFPKLGDGWIVSAQADLTSTTYMKDHRMYLLDPSTGQWLYVEMPEADPAEIRIHDRVNDFMTVTRDAMGLTLTSTRPLSALEFYSLTGIEIQEQPTLDALASQGQTMETMVTFILDEHYRYKTVIYEQVIATAGATTSTASTYTYSNYDTAQPVTVPAEILEKATLLDPTDRE